MTSAAASLPERNPSQSPAKYATAPLSPEITAEALRQLRRHLDTISQDRDSNDETRVLLRSRAYSIYLFNLITALESAAENDSSFAILVNHLADVAQDPVLGMPEFARLIAHLKKVASALGLPESEDLKMLMHNHFVHMTDSVRGDNYQEKCTTLNACTTVADLQALSIPTIADNTIDTHEVKLRQRQNIASIALLILFVATSITLALTITAVISVVWLIMFFMLPTLLTTFFASMLWEAKKDLNILKADATHADAAALDATVRTTSGISRSAHEDTRAEYTGGAGADPRLLKGVRASNNEYESLLAETVASNDRQPYDLL